VINRSGPRDSIIEGECQSRGVPVMLRIPLDRRIAEAYSRGETLVGAFPEYAERLRELHRAIHTRAAA
jgi:MinD superfamily P-loop ATPase